MCSTHLHICDDAVDLLNRGASLGRAGRVDCAGFTLVYCCGAFSLKPPVYSNTAITYALVQVAPYVWRCGYRAAWLGCVRLLSTFCVTAASYILVDLWWMLRSKEGCDQWTANDRWRKDPIGCVLATAMRLRVRELPGT